MREFYIFSVHLDSKDRVYNSIFMLILQKIMILAVIKE